MKKPLLLGCKGCGNAIVECAFAVAGIAHDYEEVDYSEGSETRPRLLEVNPLGQVPTLRLPDGSIMTESLAMIHWANDQAPRAGLIPAAGDPDRAAFLRWSTFIVAAIYPTFTYGDDPARWVKDPQGARLLKNSTDHHRENLWQQMDGISGAPWFLGEQRTALDLYVAVMTRWRPGRPWFNGNAKKLAAVADRAAAIPEVGAVLKRNF